VEEPQQMSGDAKKEVFRKVSRRMWRDERFGRLTEPSPCGRYLWIYLITGPFTSRIPGCVVAKPAVLAADLGWEPEAFREAFQEVLNEGLAKADEKAGLIWLPKGPNHNRPENPNVVKSWRTDWDMVPECPLKSEVWRDLKAFLEGFGEGFADAFAKCCPKPCRIQEQEQEQEKEENVPASAGTPVGSSTPTPEAGAVKEKSAKTEKPVSEDAVAVSAYLLEAIRSHQPDVKDGSQKWSKDIDIAIRMDRRSPEALRSAIDYAHRSTAGSFWQANLLSGEKLRKHFDTLQSQMKRAGFKSAYCPPRQSSGDVSYDVEWDEIDNLGTREEEHREKGLPIPWLTNPRRWAMTEDRCGHKLEPCGPGTHDAQGKRLRIA
jgi:hypothetical protein